MSFEAELQSAVFATLQGVADINGVFPDRPMRATPPYLVLGELLSADWGAKASAGREVRLLVRVHDAGESSVRIVALQGEVCRAIEALPRDVGGWRVGSVTLLRSRTFRDGASGWAGAVEYRIRAMEV